MTSFRVFDEKSSVAMKREEEKGIFSIYKYWPNLYKCLRIPAKYRRRLAWLLCFSAVTCSATFTLFYSMQWGPEISEQWLTSMMMSFFQDAFVTQPVKVVGMALLFSLILTGTCFCYLLADLGGHIVCLLQVPVYIKSLEISQTIIQAWHTYSNADQRIHLQYGWRGEHPSGVRSHYINHLTAGSSKRRFTSY